MRLGVREALVDGELVAGDVEVDGDTITAVGVQPAAANGTAVPGFVDLQVNGFGGIDFQSCDVEGYRTARAALAATGVTAFQPTLVTAPVARIERALATISAAQPDDGSRILGAHLEGPFLSPRFKGAHDERHLLAPDIDVAARLCAAGPVTYMTLAPELPGAMELLAWLVERGIVVSLGHTDADADAANAAYDAGARTVTHLYNAQRRFTARDPGITGVALTRADVIVQVIADFVHLAPETVLATHLAVRDRLVLVTDAIAAATAAVAATDGSGALAPGGSVAFPIGDRTLHVDETSARLDDGTLAGSVLTMDRAVRNLVSLGIPLVEALGAASTTPATLVGRPELGTLAPGTPADVAVLDDDLRVTRTILGGREGYVA
jgi:N-acetylglucosamine-6-phosphate deacetylase